MFFAIMYSLELTLPSSFQNNLRNGKAIGHLNRATRKQQTSEALLQYQQALTIREQSLGPHHPKTIVTRIAYIHLLSGINN